MYIIYVNISHLKKLLDGEFIVSFELSDKHSII